MKASRRPANKTTYIALLRGINVAGHKPVKMDQLRRAFEALGLEDVKTYVQSGNVVFNAPTQTSENLSRKIEEKIRRDFGIAVPVTVKTSVEVAGVIRNNPFLQEKGIDHSKLHVTFLSQAPQKAALKMLDAIAKTPDQFRCSGKEIYLYCPNGYGITKLSNNALEKALSVRATTRNWKTVTQLYEMTLADQTPQ
jgi:uncharacterized protein (DUF1697 family)